MKYINHKTTEISFYIFVILLYLVIFLIIPYYYYINNVEINLYCTISEMRDLCDHLEPYNKEYKPGYPYYGSASNDIIKYKISNITFIDPFIRGKHKKYISYEKNHFIYKHSRKGDLLKYYTDGESISVIISAGPDQIYENYNINRKDIFNNPDIMYDPTNGLYSRGDILMIFENSKYLQERGNHLRYYYEQFFKK